MFKNKKGDIGDFFILLIIVFMTAVSFYAGTHVWNQYQTKMQDTGLMEQYPQSNETMNRMNNTFNILDLVWVILFFGFYLAILVSVANQNTSPWFIVVFLLFFMVIMAMGFIFSDTTMSILNDPTLNQTASQYPKMYSIMSTLPIWLFFILLLFMIVMFGVKKSESSI
jgi:F0F1-type ATP synthase assembly protein I